MSQSPQANPFMGGYLQSLQQAYQQSRSPQGRAQSAGFGGSQWSAQPSRYTPPGDYGYTAQAAPARPSSQGQFASPLDPGGIYGSSKWNGGTAADIFMRRGSPVYAPFDGMLESGIRDVPPGPMGVPPGFYLRGQGLTERGIHIEPLRELVGKRVRAGQVIGYVNDRSMDMLGQYPGMPDGYQHADLAFSRSGQFSASGGDLDARQVLKQMGYQGTQIQGRTNGPPDAMGGMSGQMGMGMPGMPGFGGGMQPGGMPGGMNPFMRGFGSGMPGFGGQMGGQNPFMMQIPQMQQMMQGGRGMQMPMQGGFGRY